MKLLLLVLTLLMAGHAMAQSCQELRQRGTGNIPSTCLKSELNTSLGFREDVNTVSQFGNSVLNEVPFFETVKLTIEHVTKFDPNNTYDNQRVRDSLSGYLQQYVKEVNHGTVSADPQTIYNLTQASIKYFMELNELLGEKKLTVEERHQIQTVMFNLKFIFDGGASYLTANHLSSMQKEIKELQQQIKKGVDSIDFKRLAGDVQVLLNEIENLKGDLKKLQETPGASPAEIEKIKKKISDLQGPKRSDYLVEDIKNYTNFAQGMVALYSLFDPAHARQLAGAVSGLSNLGIGIATISSLAEGAASSAYLGAYGMMASGAVQVFTALQTQKDSSMEAFEEIFKQLRVISAQINDLRVLVDRRFDRLEYDVFRVERSILERLGTIETRISDLAQLAFLGQETMLEIERSVKELSRMYVENRISDIMKDEYFPIVHQCLGKRVVNVKLTPEAANDCLDSFMGWLDNRVRSPLFTRKMSQYQYEIRGNFDYQINDVAAYYRQYSKDYTVTADLANPRLLKDLSQNIGLIGQTADHEIFAAVKKEEEKLENFRKKLANDKEFFQYIDSEYRKQLSQTHERIRNKLESLADTQALDFHRSRLNEFKRMVSTELILRGKPKSTDAGAELFKSIVLQDFNTTLKTLETYRNRLKDLVYEGDILSLIKEEKIIVFANNCDPAENKIDIPVPVPVSYLKKKLSEAVVTRLLLAPSKNDFCYHLKLEENTPLFKTINNIAGRDYMRIHRPWGDLQPTGGLFEFTNSEAGFNYKAHGSNSLTISHRGYFLKSLTLVGRFQGVKVLQEEVVLPQRMKLAWHNGATDPLSLLTFNLNESYVMKYPPYPAGPNGITVVETISDFKKPAIENGILFDNAKSSSEETDRMRAHVLGEEQEKLLSLDIARFKRSIMAEGTQFIKNMDMRNLTELGRLLTTGLFFRDEQDFGINIKYLSNLSETWGLRSEQSLKNFYIDVLVGGDYFTDVDFVLKNQIQVLDDLTLSE